MRILYLGNSQGFSNSAKYYFTPEKLINGFTRLGHHVYAFNDRDFARYSNIFRSQKMGKKALNEKIITVCREYQPDLIMLGHCKNIDNNTLAEIRQIMPDIKISYRNVDPLNSQSNVAEINQRVGHVDSIFITTAGDGLKQFTHPKTKTSFMPNPVDPAVEDVCAFKNPIADIDFLFLGSALRDQDDHRVRTVQYLRDNQGDLNMRMAGMDNANGKVFGRDYYTLLNRCKSGLCMNKTEDYYLYASGRMSQYMASGLLAYIPKGPQFEDIFDDDSFITTSSDEELLDKIKYYTANDTERTKIAETGYTKIRDFFLVDKVCQYMIEVTFDQPLSQAYKWPTVLY